MLLHRNNWILLNQLSHNSPSLTQLYPPILCKTCSPPSCFSYRPLNVPLELALDVHLKFSPWSTSSKSHLEFLTFGRHIFNTGLPGLPSETKVFACPSICCLMLLLSPFISVQETNSFGNIIFPFVKHRQICWW